MNKGDAFRQSYHVSASVLEQFMVLFNDRNLLHTSDAYALRKGFPGRIMHGTILNGFLSHFIGECLPLKNVMIQQQEIKYHHPVFINDQLELIAEVLDYFDAVRVFEIKFRFLNQQNIKIASGKIQIGLL